MKLKLIVFLAALTSAVMLYQNCGSKVTFTQLTAGPIDNNGNAINNLPPGEPGAPTPTPTIAASPSPESSPAASPTAAPSASPGASPEASPGSSPVASATPVSSGTEQVCILVNGGNKGVNNRVGYDTGLLALDDVHAIPKAACMSAHACLDLINDYLNSTGGSLTGVPGPMPTVKSNYTMQKFSAVCAHNPNVKHMSDADVQAALDHMAASAH